MNKRNHSVKDDTSAASLMLPELSSGGFTRENTEEPAQLLTQQIDVQKALKKNKKIKLKPMQSADDVSRISSSPKKGGNNSTQILDGSSVTSVNAQSIDAIDVSKASTMPPSGRGQRGGIVVIDHRSEKEKEQKVEAVKEMIEKSKAVGGSVTRKMFKLPIKLVNECKDSSSNQPAGSQSASGKDSKGSNKPSLFEQLKARLSKDSNLRQSLSAGNLSTASTPKGNNNHLNTVLTQNTAHSNNGNTSVNVINFNFYNKSQAKLAIPIASDLLLDEGIQGAPV